MKLNRILHRIALALLVWFATVSVVKGVALTGSITYNIMVLGLYIGATFLVLPIRKFFIFPKNLYIKILIQSLLFAGVLLLALNITGGLRLVELNTKIIDFIMALLPRAKVGIFGTITIVSFSLGTTLQTIILLGKDK